LEIRCCANLFLDEVQEIKRYRILTFDQADTLGIGDITIQVQPVWEWLRQLEV